MNFMPEQATKPFSSEEWKQIVFIPHTYLFYKTEVQAVF